MKRGKNKGIVQNILFIIFMSCIFIPKIYAETILDCSNDKCDFKVAIKQDSNYQYYNTLNEAISNIPSSDKVTIYLVNDNEITSVVNIPTGYNIVIDGQDKYNIKSSSESEYTGTFFNIEQGTSEEPTSITIKNTIIDAGAKIEINNETIQKIKKSTPQVATSKLESDYFNIDSNSKITNENLIKINSYSNLYLYNSSVQNFHSTNAVIFGVSSNGNVLLNNSNIQNNYFSSSSKLSTLSGTFKLENNSSIKNNYIISNGGTALFNTSSGTFIINDTSSIINNLAINASYMFYINGNTKVIINEDMKDGKYKTNGVKISNNISYPGPSTSLSTFFYNYTTNNGNVEMYGGEITNNIGGKYVIMDQRRPLDVLNWENGIIKNNISVYDNGTIISMRGSDVGKNMIIEDSVYIRLGGTDDLHYFTNKGTMNGNILISQLGGTFTNEGEINGNMTIDSSYSPKQSVFTGTINGKMTFQNKADGLIKGIVNNNVYVNSNSKLEISGTINGNVYVDMTNNTNELPLYGNGTINGYVIYKYNDDTSIPDLPSDLVINKNIIKYNPQNEVIITIDYNGEKDTNGMTYSIISAQKDSIIDLSNINFSSVKKDFENWYTDKNLTTKWNNKASENTTIYAKWIEHKHKYIFEEQNNIIYKICGCGEKEEYIKLDEPQDIYYDGNEKEVNIITESATNYKVKYQKLNENGKYEDIEETPTEIGKYKAILEYNDLIIEESYVIMEKPEDTNIPSSDIKKDEDISNEENNVENPFTSDKMIILFLSLSIILTSLFFILMYLRKKSKGNIYYT